MTILAVGFDLSLKPLKLEAAWPRVSAPSIISEQANALCAGLPVGSRCLLSTRFSY